MNTITQAFVLGAGLGTRLRPLTEDLPKPLIPIFQKPLITFALDHLIDMGVESFVINTHKLPELFRELFSRETSIEGHSVTLVHEPVLLETGGGIKNVERLSRQRTIHHLQRRYLDRRQPANRLIDEHFRGGNDVTLALRNTGLASDVAFRDDRVVDISNRYGIAGKSSISPTSPFGIRRFSSGFPRTKNFLHSDSGGLDQRKAARSAAWC